MPAPRLVSVAAAAVVALVVGAVPAAAHVSVAEPVAAGGISEVTLTVPNERDDAATVAVEVKLPEDHPLPLVSPRVKPGWESTVTMRTVDEPVELFGREVTEVVDTVRWSGGSIAAGQYDSFTVRAGPFPDDVGELALPAIQTYDSGEEVGWIELAEEGAEEPEHPAPVVTIESAGAAVTGTHGEADDGAGAGAAAAPAGAEVDGEAAAASSVVEDGDEGTDAVGTIALVVAVVAALLGGAALVTARRRA
jgi:uncharacterized protein YcnI